MAASVGAEAKVAALGIAVDEVGANLGWLDPRLRERDRHLATIVDQP